MFVYAPTLRRSSSSRTRLRCTVQRTTELSIVKPSRRPINGIQRSMLSTRALLIPTQWLAERLRRRHKPQTLTQQADHPDDPHSQIDKDESPPHDSALLLLQVKSVYVIASHISPQPRNKNKHITRLSDIAVYKNINLRHNSRHFQTRIFKLTAHLVFSSKAVRGRNEFETNFGSLVLFTQKRSLNHSGYHSWHTSWSAFQPLLWKRGGFV